MRPETDPPPAWPGTRSDTDQEAVSPSAEGKFGLDHLSDLRQRVIESVVVEDPDPRYSALDQLDGLTHTSGEDGV